MVGPLRGIRILELPAIGPVPFLGMLLSDLGASVIKIDRLSDTGTGPEGPPGALDRGRRSIGLDLRKPGAAEITLELVERSDILIEGFRPGVAERFGIGPDVALERNPALIYGRMTGWGQDGPLASRAGHDITYLALSGALHGIGEHGRRPIPPVNYLADFGGGAMMLAGGILAALVHAKTTGEGQVIDAAMTEGAAYLTTMTRQFFGTGAWTDEREGNLLDGGAPNYRCYECADGRHVAVGALEQKFWIALVQTLNEDPRAVPDPYDRDQWTACAAWLADRFKTRSRDEWAEIFADTDACVAPVLSLSEAPNHPHYRARKNFVEIGGYQVAAPVPRFSRTSTAADPAVPRPGAETGAILDELEISAAVRQRLRADGAIR